MKKWLLLLTLVFSMMGAGQILLVQLSAYPLWGHVGPHEFHDYHIAWWHSIWGPIFVPAALALVCNIGLFWWRPVTVPRRALWLSVVILIIAYSVTWFWFAPLMAIIGATPKEFQDVLNWGPQIKWLGVQNLNQSQLYDLLLSTHWVRVALFVIYAMAVLWMCVLGYDEKKVKKG